MIHNNEKLRLVGKFFVSISVEGFEEANDGRRGQGHDAPKGGAASRKRVGIGWEERGGTRLRIGRSRVSHYVLYVVGTK